MLINYIKGKRILCAICILLIVGILARDMIWGRQELDLPMGLSEDDEGNELTVIGTVTKLEEKEYSQYIYLKSGEDTWLVYDYEFLELHIGNEIQVTGELKLFDIARNPGNFDFKSYYTTLGIVAGIGATYVEVVDANIYPIRNYLYELRLQGVEHIYNILGEEEGSLLVAMVFGEKNGMDDEQKELYQKIGISHIFAISGLHISLISLAVYQVLRKSTGSFVLGGIVSGILLVLYILLIGLGTSAIRAGIMFMMRVGADISGRVYDRKTSLAVAAMCILIGQPLYIYDGGFLLSFGAILGVIYLVPFWEVVLRWKNEKLSQGLGASLGIQSMILPILLYFYYEICPYSILLNIIVIPMVTILLGVAMIGIIVSLIWYGAGVVLISFCGWLLQVIDFLSTTTLSLPMSRLVIGKPWWVMILFYYIVLLGIVWYMHMIRSVDMEEHIQKKIYSKLSIIFLILPMILLVNEDVLNPIDLSITMIDVDQGDSLFVTGDGLGTYLIDGGSTGVSEVGKYRIEPYLRSIGISQLDYVFISHGDSDHLNGVSEMLARQELGIRIHTLVLCAEKFHDEAYEALIETAKTYGTQVAIMEAGMTITDGALSITCIAPLDTYEGDIGNESSMILDVSYDELQVLFTGDVEGEGEEQLIEILEESGEQYQILKVAHHGSSNSTNAQFLELIQPDIALISAGVDSIYGHPHEATIELLEEYECDIYTTSVNGGVILSYNANNDTIFIEETIVVDD